MKVETFMRFTKLKHDIAYEPNSHNAPKGQLPYLTDDEKIISDSSDIIRKRPANYIF